MIIRLHRRQLWLLLAVVGLIIAGIGALRAGAGFNSKASGEIAAVVNGEPIPMDVYRALLRGLATERLQFDRQTHATAMDALIDQELIYQAGVRSGLLTSDPVIRRRVVQLMLDQMSVAIPEPDEATLRAYYAQQTTRYASEAQVQFRQIFFPASGGDEIATVEEAVRLRASLQTEADFVALQKSWIDKLRVHDDDLFYPESRLTSLYGLKFANLLVDAPLQVAAGPYPSSLGLHVVWVAARKDGERTEFEAALPQIVQDWRQDERNKTIKTYLEDLRRNAKIKVYVGK